MMTAGWIGDVEGKAPCVVATDEQGAAVLVGCLCANCGTVAFPASDACIGCGTGGPSATPLPRVGQLYSWTRVHVSNSRAVPYWLGYVDFIGDTRVLGELRPGANENAVRSGLDLVVRSDATGQWWFEPAGPTS